MFKRNKSRGPLRRLLGLAGPGRLALAAWAWKNRHDLMGWAQLAGRAPASIRDPAKRDLVVSEAKVRASITRDHAARAAGLTVEMVGATPHVVATRGSDDERRRALERLQSRRPDVVIVDAPQENG